MILLTASFHQPFLLAQADTPATDSSATSSYVTVNGRPATPEEIAAMKKAGATGGIIGLLLLVVFIAALWRLFTKAGKPGWASIVPLYNAVVMLEIAGRPAWWIILLFIPFVNFIVLVLVMIDLAKSFGYGIGFALGLIFLSPIFFLILGFGSARYVGPGGRLAAGAFPGALPPGGYPPVRY